MWPFTGRTVGRRIERAREMMKTAHFLDAIEELKDLEDPTAQVLREAARRGQIARLLREIAEQRYLGDESRSRDFEAIARRLGATDDELAGARRVGERASRRAGPGPGAAGPPAG